MTFGKHRGSLIEDVPVDYLAWVLKSCENADPWLLESIREFLGAHQRSKAPPPPPPPRDPPPWTPPPDPGRDHLPKARVADVIKAVHRKLAGDWHPDRRGGNGDGMTALNAFRDKLEQTLVL